MDLPLEGRNILITREKTQAHEFSKKVEKLGGRPVTIPLLKIICVNTYENIHILQELDHYEWIFFTSANGVECFFHILRNEGLDETAIINKKLAVVGHKTENRLKMYGITADFIPSIYDADHMAKEFLAKFHTKGPILLVRGNKSRDVLPVQFSQLKMDFDSMLVYETIENSKMKSKLNTALSSYKFDFITFTSPSTVDTFIHFIKVQLQYNQLNKHAVIVCIGRTTANRAKQLGFTNVIVPDEYTIDGMIQSMINYR